MSPILAGLAQTEDNIYRIVIVVDPQNDFASKNVYEDATLSVSTFDATCISCINELMSLSSIQKVYITADLHPVDHTSFVTVSGEPLNSACKFPSHCVLGAVGAEIVSALHIPDTAAFFGKGYMRLIEQFGGGDAVFVRMGDRYKKKKWEKVLIKHDEVTLNQALCDKIKKVNADIKIHIFIVGVAGDYCVNATVQEVATYLKNSLGLAYDDHIRISLFALRDGIAFLNEDIQEKIYDSWQNVYAVNVMSLQEYKDILKKQDKCLFKTVADA